MDPKEAREFGTTTGRKRRLGWFDAVVVHQSVNLSGVDSIAVTKLDVLDRLKEIKICVGYRKGADFIDFPFATQEMLKELQGEQPDMDIPFDLGEISSDSIQMYLREIGKVSLLKGAEEIELAKRIGKGQDA